MFQLVQNKMSGFHLFGALQVIAQCRNVSDVLPMAKRSNHLKGWFVSSSLYYDYFITSPKVAGAAIMKSTYIKHGRNTLVGNCGLNPFP